MTINKLASEICKREGKKSQARIGDVREILAILSDIFYENYVDQGVSVQDVIEATSFIDSPLVANGFKRAKKKTKKLRRKNATTK